MTKRKTRTAQGSAGPLAELSSSTRGIGRELARFDVSGFAPIPGGHAALGVVAALAIGLIVRHPAVAASMTAGALLVSIPAAIARRPLSFAMLSAIALSMAVSTFVGSASGSIGWLHTVVLIPWCLAGGLLIGAENASSVGNQSVAAMIVFGHFTESPLSALTLASYVLAGGAIATAVQVVTRTSHGGSARIALAEACETVARLARNRSEADSVAAAETIEAASVVVERERPLERGLFDPLLGLLDVLRRVRLEVIATDLLLHRSGPTAAAGGPPRSFGSVDTVLCSIAEHLRGGPRMRASHTATAAPLELPTRTDLGGDGAVLAAAHFEALAGQLRGAIELTRSIDAATGTARPVGAAVALARRPPDLRGSIHDLLDAARSNATFASPIGRHAVRLAAAVTAAGVLANHIGLQRSYWIALTVSVVLRPEFGSTFGRGVARVVGTCFGAVLASLLAALIGGRAVPEVIAIGILCAAVCACFGVSYVAFSCLLTALVVLILGVASPPTASVALARLSDTAIGGAIALACFVLWPTQSRAQLQPAVAAYAAATRDHLCQLLACLDGSSSIDRRELHLGSRAVRRAVAEARAVLARTDAEPWSARSTISAARRLVDAIGRVSLAGYALRADLESGRIGAPRPELADFATRSCTQLADLVERLWRPSSTIPADSALVAVHNPPRRSAGSGSLRAALTAVVDERQLTQAALFEDLDELVDATDTWMAIAEDAHDTFGEEQNLVGRTVRRATRALPHPIDRATRSDPMRRERS